MMSRGNNRHRLWHRGRSSRASWKKSNVYYYCDLGCLAFVAAGCFCCCCCYLMITIAFHDDRNDQMMDVYPILQIQQQEYSTDNLLFRTTAEKTKQNARTKKEEHERNALMDEILLAHYHENHNSISNNPHDSMMIPRLLVFTHETNLLDPRTANHTVAQRFIPNILHTIHIYQQAWSGGNHSQTESKSRSIIPVWFLDNAQCRRALYDIHPELAHYFHQEPKGMYKADLCRLAALYWTGGYYMDVDLQAIQPVTFASMTTTTNSTTTSFSTVLMLEGALVFFQAFLASHAQNPILYMSLCIMLQYYAAKDKRDDFIQTTIQQEMLLSVATKQQQAPQQQQ